MLLVGGISLVYVVAFIPLHHLMENSVGIVATFPVLAAAWFFGPYGGMLAGLLTLPLHALLITQFAGQELAAWAADGGVLGSFAEVLVGGLVGYVRRLQLQSTSLLKEQARMEQAHRESRERFELAADGAAQGMWDWPDTSQDAQWWSPRWYELLGYADEEVEASFSNFKAFLHPGDRDELAHRFTRHLEQQVPLRWSTGFERNRGTIAGSRDVVNHVWIRMGKSSVCQVPFETLPNSVPWTHDFERSRSWRVLACSPEDSPTTSTTS